MRALFHILLLSLSLSLSCGTLLATRRTSVVASITVGSSTYLTERTWPIDPIEDEEYTEWRISSDSRFPNGVFIEQLSYGTPTGLVWDIKGKSAVAGAALILSPKKNTLADTKSQRWVQTANNQYSAILWSDMVVTVNATGLLVLAKKSSTNTRQQFFPVELKTIWIKNNLRSELYVKASNSFGWGHEQVIPSFDYEYEWAQYPLRTFIGSTVNFYNDQGTLISPPSPFNATGLWDDFDSLTINEPVSRLPLGTHTLNGTIDGTLDSTMTVTITSNGVFEGTGFDGSGAGAKSFDVYGRVGGPQLLNFGKSFANGDYHSMWDGGVSYDPFTISGTLYSDSAFIGWFHYEIIN